MEHEVLIGTVKNKMQFEVNLNEKFYHIPEAVIPKNMFPVKYVALYIPLSVLKDENASCIPYYGEVESIELVEREKITSLPTHNANLKYYKINVKEWINLPNKITRVCGSIYAKAFTTLDSLLGAKDLSDLINTRYAEIRKIRSCGFTKKELESIETTKDPVGIKLLTARINKAAGCEKILPVQISKYLLEHGYLEMEFDEKTKTNNRVASDSGKILGIETFWEINKYYREYCKNYYNIDAQKFIIEHLNEIVLIKRSFAYKNE